MARKNVHGIPCEQMYRSLIETIIKSTLFEGLPGDKQAELTRLLVASETPTPYLSLEWRWAWSVSVNLYVSFAFQKHENIEDSVIHWYTPKVEVSWSSTSRSPSTARAAIALYSEVTDLACVLQAIGEDNPTYRLMTVKEAK